MAAVGGGGGVPTIHTRELASHVGVPAARAQPRAPGQLGNPIRAPDLEEEVERSWSHSHEEREPLKASTASLAGAGSDAAAARAPPELLPPLEPSP